ncbi:hypothetical protein C8R47DRAFT_1072037 [Mycena vitilis]|nr:hypothetical protein C8R47DRAFT_1072037 [Mycena vitilis]
MFRTPMITSLFAMLVLGQSVLGAPQVSPCGEPEVGRASFQFYELRSLIHPACLVNPAASKSYLPAGVCGEVCALVNETNAATQGITSRGMELNLRLFTTLIMFIGSPQDPPCPVGLSCCLPVFGAAPGVCGEFTMFGVRGNNRRSCQGVNRVVKL